MQAQKQAHLPSSEASLFNGDVSQKKNNSVCRRNGLGATMKKADTALEPLEKYIPEEKEAFTSLWMVLVDHTEDKLFQTESDSYWVEQRHVK